MLRPPPRSTLCPYTTLFRSRPPRSPRRGPGRSLRRPPSLVSRARPAVRHAAAKRHGRDAAREYAAGLHDEAPALGTDLGADRPVQARRDRVERVLDEGAVDGRAAAVPD